MKQEAFPFHETAEDATNTAIIRSGKAFKDIALSLWPEMKADSAYAKLKNGLRPDSRERLSADQHIFIANLIGEYDFLFYIAQGCHHSKPEYITPEDEAEQLQRQVLQMGVELKQALNRLDALTARRPA